MMSSSPLRKSIQNKSKPKKNVQRKSQGTKKRNQKLNQSNYTKATMPESRNRASDTSYGQRQNTFEGYSEQNKDMSMVYEERLGNMSQYDISGIKPYSRNYQVEGYSPLRRDNYVKSQEQNYPVNRTRNQPNSMLGMGQGSSFRSYNVIKQAQEPLIATPQKQNDAYVPKTEQKRHMNDADYFKQAIYEQELQLKEAQQRIIKLKMEQTQTRQREQEQMLQQFTSFGFNQESQQEYQSPDRSNRFGQESSDKKDKYLVTPKMLADKYPNNTGGELEFKVTRHDISFDDPQLQKAIKQRQKEEEEREAKLNKVKPGEDPTEGLSGLELSIARYELERKKEGHSKWMAKKDRKPPSLPFGNVQQPQFLEQSSRTVSQIKRTPGQALQDHINSTAGSLVKSKTPRMTGQDGQDQYQRQMQSARLYEEGFINASPNKVRWNPQNDQIMNYRNVHEPRPMRNPLVGIDPVMEEWRESREMNVHRYSFLRLNRVNIDEGIRSARGKGEQRY